MSNVYKLPAHDERYDEASVWITKMDNGLAPGEEKALRQWMSVSDENRDLLLGMAKLWDKMDTLSRLSEIFPHSVIQQSEPRWRALGLAASVLIAVLIGMWGVTKLAPSDLSGAQDIAVTAAMKNTYETAIGEHSTVTLSDGTQLTLNTNSLVTVDYSEHHRLLRLKRGEIHVQVAQDQARPFSVIVGDRIVQAVGTAFSLEITSDQQIELIVTEGKVLVGVHQKPPGDTVEVTPRVLAPSSVVVAGEEFVLGSAEEEITEVSLEEIEVKLSWRQGNLIFRGESLEVAMAEIGRYTTVEFVIIDDDLKTVRIAGLFRAGDVDGLLATLRENFDISHQHIGDGKILLNSL